MTIAENLRIIAERLEAASLPDHLRGDGPCADCGTFDNPVWFTNNILWNHVTGETVVAEDPRQAILCPNCFVKRADAAGLDPTGWQLTAEWPWRAKATDSAAVEAPIEQAGPPEDASAPNVSGASPGLTAPPGSAGVVQKAKTPARHAGGAGSTPATRSTSPQSEGSRRSAAERSAPVHCPDCDWVGKPGGLGVHRRHRHGYKAGDAGSRDSSINCPECGESIAQKQNLARHRRVAHGIEPWQPTPVVPTNGAPVMRKGAEWFVCARCPLKFPTRDARDRHQVTHPPIPPAAPLRSIGRGGV